MIKRIRNGTTTVSDVKNLFIVLSLVAFIFFVIGRLS